MPGHRLPDCGPIMNQVGDLEAGRRVQQKLILSCDRFLNLEICAGAVLPADSQLSAADPRDVRWRCTRPTGSFGRGVEALTVRLVGEHRGPWQIAESGRDGRRKAGKDSIPRSGEQPIPRPSLLAPGQVKM